MCNMIVRQQAFEGNNRMLKGGLHCHTTRSDGEQTPEEVIALHKENGYDFLAITDHRKYNYHNFAPEYGITIIPGMEFDNTIYNKKAYRCFHTVCLGVPEQDGNPYKQDETFESGKAKDQEEYQQYLDEFHANKNITLYCHPVWSSTPARFFEKQKGNFAMEIWNSGCAIEDDIDKDAEYWDELLQQGIKIYGAATDDGHKKHHHCKGWVNVNAENDVNSILNALKDGKFYSSCGPEIYDFYIEDGIIKIDCSPAEKINSSPQSLQIKVLSSYMNLTSLTIFLQPFGVADTCGRKSVVFFTSAKVSFFLEFFSRSLQSVVNGFFADRKFLGNRVVVKTCNMKPEYVLLKCGEVSFDSLLKTTHSLLHFNYSLGVCLTVGQVNTVNKHVRI